MKRAHEMPFGATVLDGGGARFRLWAPAARKVELLLRHSGDDKTLPMPEMQEGWRELVVPEALAGDRYRYRIDGGQVVPDPASRRNPEDVHGPSELVDARAFDWQDPDWRGRPWDEAVIYELHVGTFSPEGTFAGVEAKLDHLRALGITAIELMPLSDFPGARGWGYDGVLHFAPESRYGRPEDLKRLVQAAHQRGLMVMLDVVYNHFGPEGNYLHVYAPQFFTDSHQTPWGKAIAFEGEGALNVRSFFVHNALYWLEEYHFDGLRFDAVHEIHDASSPDILTEIAHAVHAGPGRDREIHLVLENDLNSARRLARSGNGAVPLFTGQWNDDFHHAMHALLTGERDGYYADYPHDAPQLVGRCLAEGFAYQGEPSPFRKDRPRGEPSRALPPGAFVCFVQNHDQVGNRAFGERLSALLPGQALDAAAAVLLLAPAPPMLFMGEEFAASTPFLFFADFSGELAQATREGRQREFAGFKGFSGRTIPDPLEQSTFERSRLDWSSLAEPAHARALEHHRKLLDLRRREIVPLLPHIVPGAATWKPLGRRALAVRWPADKAGTLHLFANLGQDPVTSPGALPGRILYCEAPGQSVLAPWSVLWTLEAAA